MILASIVLALSDSILAQAYPILALALYRIWDPMPPPWVHPTLTLLHQPARCTGAREHGLGVEWAMRL